MNNTYFDGKVETPSNNFNSLPIIQHDALTNPKDYRASKELAAAVNVALTLGMPLLLTGEPGCGKSELARRLAWELGFPRSGNQSSAVLKYAVKSTTEARDLFYTFDTVGRFHAAQSSDGTSTEATNYIQYQALGLALLRAKGRNGHFPVGTLSKEMLTSLPEAAHRSVVLIDEIDKAPRDVPNDILNEIEHLEFTIPELGGIRISLDADDAAHKPVVIITSNSERDLPAAFLRRCVYYHVPFPPFESDGHEGVTVENIVNGRMGKRFESWSKLQREAIDLCRYIRRDQHGLNKPPSLAEILNWMSFLADVMSNGQDVSGEDFGLADLDQKACLLAIKTTLLKTRDDQDRAESLYQSWQTEQQ